MRTFEEIKKDQDEAIVALGYHIAMAEQAKRKIFKLADEAESTKENQDAEKKD